MVTVVSFALAAAALGACSSSSDSAPTSPSATGGPSSVAATPPTATSAATTTSATTVPPPTPTSATTEALPLDAPSGDAFYTPPSPLPGDAPGDLIWARSLDNLPADTIGWQVLYRSESMAGDPVAVSGVVITPATKVGTDLPVLSWAHGTTGMDDACAPSAAYGAPGTGEDALATVTTAAGWVFVATDYEGLGGPGVHPYLVGQSEGRGVLDIVRAAAQLDESGVTASSPVALFGHSQGGHAVLMANEIAPTYAPELDLVGTVAAAPPTDLGLIASAIAEGGALSGFGLMLAEGFHVAYPSLPLDAIVTPGNEDALDAVGALCLGEAFEYAGTRPGILLDATKNPDWAAALAANSPGSVIPASPVLIVHGDADQVVPPVLSEMVEQDYCQLGVDVDRRVYPGADHGSVITDSSADVQLWLQQRLSGAPTTPSC